MKRLSQVCGAIVATTAVSFLGAASARFDQKLPIEKQAVHVLNRLTCGARTGDVEQVRRIGIDKWIDQQLHHEQIAENPALDAKLQPLGTLQLATWQIAEKYPQQIFPTIQPAFASLPPQQI